MCKWVVGVGRYTENLCRQPILYRHVFEKVGYRLVEGPQ